MVLSIEVPWLLLSLVVKFICCVVFGIAVARDDVADGTELRADDLVCVALDLTVLEI